ncbi:two-component regulator propeller domain-containing protein [Rufibacter glacialis]|uniref:histidine kinase n=1 Tax=Rufibacter glacialis TaxID=1259555 RepID=A0A5M8Q6M9_9BACT|nr:hybrid sensor histidine kinase/response regulator transcription factor [Rufibacter glacialis]KAA6430272.1 response regulator [Rufibacter glacialis]GGK87882.1 hybrid sensor histidine kinase/response regulator [Rufibacter glacialis]
MGVRKGIIVVLLVLGVLPLALAQVPTQFRFSLIDIDQGLSSNQVKCFLKDSRGYLWVGTMAGGLNRYDGYKLKVYKYRSDDTTSLISNDVTRLLEAPDGKIWVQTLQGGCVFDPVTGKFQRNLREFYKTYHLPANAAIEDILKDCHGDFWFALAGQGLFKYQVKNRKTIPLQHAFSAKGSLSTNDISGLGQTSQGHIWVVHKNGILEKLDGQTLKVVERQEEMYRHYSQETLDYAVTVDSADDLWLYVREKEGGVYFYSSKAKTLRHFHKSSPGLQLSNNVIRGIVEAEPGQLWIGADHGGINVIDKKSLTVRYIRHNEEVAKSLAHNSINTLYKDNEGIVWVGTFKKGINYYHKNLVRFPLVRHQPSLPGSLPFDDINAFAEDGKGNLWIGTNGEGLLYLDRATGKYTRYRHNPAGANSLANDVVVSLLLDRHQNLWVGTYLGGLSRFNGQTFTHYKNEPGNPRSLSDNSVWELYEDTQGHIWVGTLRGGLELFDPAQNGFIHSSVGTGKFPIHCDYISSITQDRHGNLWVGGGYGIDVFHKETGKSSYFSHDPRNPRSLISNNITYIHRDSRNRIWIGTTEGLDLYQEKGNTFTHFTVKDGLPNNTITTILEDKNGQLWVSTHNGIAQLTVQQKGGKYSYHFRNFDEQDGLQGKAFNENAALRTRRGELIFGGANGFNLFRPEQIRKNQAAPRVVFTDFQLFNQSLEAGQPVNGRVILAKAVSDTDQITLEHDENAFSLEFAALNFLHPEKNQYRYRLEGFDKEWHTVTDNNRKITYTNLDPGTYVFNVMASNNDGVWTPTATRLTITVLAPFWQTPLAFGLYVVLAIIALVLIRRVELRRTTARFELEQERRQAHQLHELDLLKIKFFTNISHEFRTPLTLILAPLEKLLKGTEDPGQRQQFQMIQKNAKRLLHMVNQLLDFKKMDLEDMRLSPTRGEVVAFVQETVHSFANLSDTKGIALNFSASVKELTVYFDHDKLEKILFNLLSNAFKFTPPQGQIHVELHGHTSDSSSEGIMILELKVRDTGIGIAKENHKKIFDRFFRDTVPAHLMNQGSGIGLALVQEFVHLHGGVITVDSAPGSGSCFTVTIPVKESVEKAPETILSAPYEPAEEPASPADRRRLAFPEPKPVVLVAEDNEDFRFFLKDSLSPHFHILEAQDGKEGWQKALAYLPDLIVSDLMMPVVDGMEFCQKIKGDPRTSQIPFVLLTAHTSDEKKLKGLDIGANDYLTKPFHFDMLLSRIRNLIAQRELLQKVFEKKISVQASQNEIVSLDDKLIRKAIQYVEDHLSNPDLSVEEMSRELGVSRVHLYKKMVAITGQSPVEFIRKIRLQHATQFLEKSQLTVAEVAYKVGFNNRKYFTKYFKEEYHILPSQYAESRQAAKPDA